MKLFNRYFLPCFYGALLLVLPMASLQAGFLDMPEIKESPELQQKTLLKDIDIMSVRNRDEDRDTRLSVTQFRLQGIVEFPKLGITLEEVQRVVEEIRFEMMAEDKLLESGYTPEEIAAVSDLLVQIEDETKGRLVGEDEVQQLVLLIRDQLASRGITLDMIETVADTITNYYRTRGFILAKAYIPKQEVRDGVVNLTLLLGMLGDVDVNGATIYKDRVIEGAFKSMLGKPVTAKATEERLFLLNDYPGISVNGFFEACCQVGDSKLNVNVTSQDRLQANVRFDNHGSEQTGDNRLYGELLWNNPAGIADQLQLGVLQTGNPSNSTFGQFRYNTRVLSPKLTLELGFSSNDFVLGGGNSEDVEALQLEGETNVFDFSASYALRRSRKVNHSIGLSFQGIESLLDSRIEQLNASLSLDDEIRNLSLLYSFDFLDESNNMLHVLNASFTSGEFIEGNLQAVEGSIIGQDKDYTIFSADYTLLTTVKVPFTDINTRIISRSALQLAGSSLSSISQFSLARPSRVRGFEITQFSGDSAIYSGVDWIFNLPKFINFSIAKVNVRDIARPFIFADVAYGRSQSTVVAEPDDTAFLSNIGIGVQFDYNGRLKGSLQFAWPLESDFSDEATVASDDVQGLFEIQYSF